MMKVMQYGIIVVTIALFLYARAMEKKGLLRWAVRCGRPTCTPAPLVRRSASR